MKWHGPGGGLEAGLGVYRAEIYLYCGLAENDVMILHKLQIYETAVLEL